MKELLTAGIRIYRRIPLTALIRTFGGVPPACKFFPTCSHYAEQAIALHGVKKGTRFFIRRIVRCHPLHAGGWDPVPAQGESR